MSAANFWQPFETVIDSFSELVDTIEGVMEKAVANNIQFAWRGQIDSDWSLHSSLYRRLCLTSGRTEKEDSLAREELDILTELHRWTKPLRGVNHPAIAQAETIYSAPSPHQFRWSDSATNRKESFA